MPEIYPNSLGHDKINLDTSKTGVSPSPLLQEDLAKLAKKLQGRRASIGVKKLLGLVDMVSWGREALRTADIGWTSVLDIPISKKMDLQRAGSI